MLSALTRAPARPHRVPRKHWICACARRASLADQWKQMHLGEIADLTICRTPPRKEASYWTSDLERPFCSIAELGGRSPIDPVTEGVTEAAERDGKAKRVPAGSLLMTFKLSIG